MVRECSLLHSVQTVSAVHQICCPVGTECSLLERNAYCSTPSSAKVTNVQDHTPLPRHIPVIVLLPLLMKVMEVKVFLYITNYASHEDIWISGCIDSCTLDLNTSWRCVASFMLWLHYAQEKSARYPLASGAGWAPESVLPMWRGEKCCFCWDSNCDPFAVSPVTSHYISYAILAPFILVDYWERDILYP
jgi:hypothetical protein